MSEQTTDAKPEIKFEDFAKLDLRVATVTSAEDHPNADKLLKLQLDDGSGTPRQICAGVKAHYNAEDLVGKQIIVVANLAPRELRGETSHGMLLAASDFRQMTAQLMDFTSGRLVMAHEGGYSEAHVPFCGHAVLEALSQSAIHAEDPLEPRISGQQPDPRFDALEETRLKEIASLHGLV